MNLTKFVVSIILLTSTLFSQANVAIAHENVNKQSVEAYTYEDFASYLGLTVEDFHKFTQAYALDNASPLQPSFIDIQNHPSFIEVQRYIALEEDAPGSLIVEVQSLFAKNQELLAEHMGMSVDEIEDLQTRFDELTRVTNQLQRNNQKERLGSSFSLSNSNDEIEVIVVTAKEDKLVETSSGIYNMHTTQIWDFGLSLDGGKGVSFTVEYRTPNGNYYGSQSWYADRFRVYNTSNIFCSSEHCSLNPF